MAFDHQDWNTVTFKKKPIVSKSEIQDRENKKSAYNYAMKFDPETISRPTDTKLEIRNFIKKTRNNKKITQSQLAKLLNVQNNTYNNWESGKEPIPGIYISKLNSILKVNIKKRLVL
jgi:DNA-binding XRE family transcriptional regulator